jgi:hypothetical protein
VRIRQRSVTAYTNIVLGGQGVQHGTCPTEPTKGSERQGITPYLGAVAIGGRESAMMPPKVESLSAAQGEPNAS